MMTVDTIGRVRRAYFVQGRKIKAIARELKLARNTVRDIVRAREVSAATERRYHRLVQPLPRLGAYVDSLEQILADNAKRPKRERLTYLRIFGELTLAGYAGGYDAVRRYARAWSIREGERRAEAFVPLIFAPGEAYQFDWSHEHRHARWGDAGREGCADAALPQPHVVLRAPIRARLRRWCSTRTTRRSPSYEGVRGAASTTT